jgi:hypothetical protein
MRSHSTILQVGFIAVLMLLVSPAAGVVAMPYLSLKGETVSILNAGPDPVDITGWTITDEGTTNTYTFPKVTLASWQLVTVHAGSGTNSATDLYWGLPLGHDPVLNDDGDTVTLWNTTGVRIADSNGFILGAPVFTPVTMSPLVTIPGYMPPVSPIPTPYITTPPTGVASYVPITPPYPTTIRTLPPALTTVPTTLPIPRPPLIAPLPTRTGILPAVALISPSDTSNTIIASGVKPLPGGKRYAIGSPGSFLGTRFGTGGSPSQPRTPRTITADGTVLKPGSVSFGITPPKGQFVRWYPAARWAEGIR